MPMHVSNATTRKHQGLMPDGRQYMYVVPFAVLASAFDI